jgi:hypothetical protein
LADSGGGKKITASGASGYRPAPNTVRWYLDSYCPLFSEVAALCGTEGENNPAQWGGLDVKKKSGHRRGGFSLTPFIELIRSYDPVFRSLPHRPLFEHSRHPNSKDGVVGFLVYKSR